jgi:hypothetical protein
LRRVLLEFLALDADAGRRVHFVVLVPVLLFRWIIYDSSGASSCLTRYTANYTDKERSAVARSDQEEINDKNTSKRKYTFLAF